MIDVLKKYNLGWHNRYDVIPRDLLSRVIDELYEPFKVRGKEREKLLQEHPKYIYDKNYLDGHKIGEGVDEKGLYSIFQPTQRKRYKEFRMMEYRALMLYDAFKLQQQLINPKTTQKSEFEKIEKEIDDIYKELLNLDDKENEGVLSVKWTGTSAELTELIKSLCESEVLDNNLTEKEILKRFETFFSFKIKSYPQNKTKIRDRKNDTSIFLNRLITKLESWAFKND